MDGNAEDPPGLPTHQIMSVFKLLADEKQGAVCDWPEMKKNVIGQTQGIRDFEEKRRQSVEDARDYVGVQGSRRAL